MVGILDLFKWCGVSTFFWKYIVEQYSRLCRCIVDCRGHGQSDRDLDPLKADMSIDRHAKDLEHVLTDAFPEYDGHIADWSLDGLYQFRSLSLLTRSSRGIFTCWGQPEMH